MECRITDFFFFFRHGHKLMGESPECAPKAGSGESEATVSTARGIGRKLRTNVWLHAQKLDTRLKVRGKVAIQAKAR